jgi:putative transposase
MNIEKTMISKNRKSIFKQLKFNNICIFKQIKFCESLDKYDICDSSISYNIRLGEYYLNLNYHDTSTKDLSILKNKKVCSIDPGTKSFVTIYSDNKVAKIGINITDKINKLCREIDIISSRIYKKISTKKYKYNHNKRKAMRKALHRKIKYLENLKEELHNKTIKYLTDNYSKIILPRFETQKMTMKFNSKIARNLNTISFYQFKIKLANKCKEKDILLEIREEYYTSKTCTCCGYIKSNLGSNRTFECDKCNLIIDRDISAARNIMLRNTNWEIPPLV